MLTERDGVQLQLHCITIEDLVPKTHFLRELEAVVDFSFIYDEVRVSYSPDNGRSGIDPERPRPLDHLTKPTAEF